MTHATAQEHDAVAAWIETVEAETGHRVWTADDLEAVRCVQVALARHERGEHQLTFTGRVLDGLMVLGCEWCSFRTIGGEFDVSKIRGSCWVHEATR
jgi:hypothetical protein